jgi:phosphoribosylglycinamide formyltransferase 1
VRVAVLVSGSGTILRALFEAGVPITTVLSDRPCRGLEIGAEFGVSTILVDRTEFGGFGPEFDRRKYTEAVTAVLIDAAPDLIAMAGFGTVLAEPIHRAFPDRIVNTHPALLPLFPGWHGVEDALAAGATETGCTVHYATLEMDAGPILARETVPIFDDDTVESLHERIKAVERRLYPATIMKLLHELEAERSGSRETHPEEVPR